MASIGSVAHIRLAGFDKEGVDSRSPLEDQAALTYKAARHYAQVNGFERYVHRGVPGVKGHMVMKRITDTLFEDEPDKDERSKINGLVTQVLRKTDAAVCVRRPADGDRESVPEWFIADSMPANLTIVALNHKHKDPIPTAKTLVPTHTEKRLTAQEAGEDRQPGDVTVRFDPEKLKNLKPEARDAFIETSQRIAQEHANFREEVYRVIVEHTPVAAPEVKLLLKDQTSPDSSATVNAVRELAEAGRIHSRVEEHDERLVRGGGSLPRGKRLQLWGPTPDPVPPRTSMPEGVAPRKAAADWAKEEAARLDTHAELILQALSDKPIEGGHRPRSRGRLMEVTGLTAEQVSVAIARLKRLDMVYENNYSFYLTDRRRDSSRKSEPAPPNAVQEQPAEDTVPATPPAPAPPASVTDIVHQISDLVVQLASGSNAGELEQLRVQVATLRTENEKLVRQNKALRAAIAAMEE